MKTMISLIVGLLLLASCTQDETCCSMESPDGELKIEVLSANDGSGGLCYQLYAKKEGKFHALTDPAPLGIVREDACFSKELQASLIDEQKGLKEQYELLTGKRSLVETTFNEMILELRNPKKNTMHMEVRAYDEGVAFRYVFPDESRQEVRVMAEKTAFNFKDGNFWAHPYDTLTQWNPAYETFYQGPMPVGTQAPWNKNGWAFPLLVESEGYWLLAAEAGFDGSYGASHLEADCEDGLYRIRFAEKGEAEGYFENTSHSTLPWELPWRFIVISKDPAGVVENDMATHLADPCQVEDLSWIRPGRSSWSWWSDNDSPKIYERLVPFVDFAADMSWEYSLVDANWETMTGGSVEVLAPYAAQKGVGLLLWYNSGGKHNIVPEGPRDLMWDRKTRRAEFKRIHELGIKGIKVDFFQSDKQEIIRQYVDILKDAAEFELLVNFHGCTLPRGWRRTWPNLMTMEAVKGGECYRFSSEFPTKAPAHLAILPFSRNAVGPCDYTPGGYTDSKFPHLTTYGFELALPVIIESGIMHHMDTPEMTRSLLPAAVDFLKDMPVAWDETRFLSGYPGKDVVVARRKGESWYIAGINGENIEKDIHIDLSKLERSPSELHLIVDGKGSRNLKTAKVIPVEGKLTLHLEAYGGFAGSW